MRLPENFEKKMRDLLKEDFDDYIACYEEPRYYGLRVNTNKISVEEFKKICPFEIEPIPWIENGFYYDGEHVTPSKHPYYFAGLYYVRHREERLRSLEQSFKGKEYLRPMILVIPEPRDF